jgi:hypothetical protein
MSWCIPASTQLIIPSAERVWATIVTPIRSASVTAALSILVLYCGLRGLDVFVNIPPVAIIFIDYAPSLT